MDYLFTAKTNGFEVGCGECALVGGVKTTKELVDAGLKMPKVMRDMANSILKAHIGLVHNLCIVGYYIGGKLKETVVFRRLILVCSGCYSIAHIGFSCWVCCSFGRIWSYSLSKKPRTNFFAGKCASINSEWQDFDGKCKTPKR